MHTKSEPTHTRHANHKGKLARILPDLRMMSNDSHELFNEIVYNGIYSESGMTAFSDVISKNDVKNIYHYIIDTAKNDRKIQQGIE